MKHNFSEKSIYQLYELEHTLNYMVSRATGKDKDDYTEALAQVVAEIESREKVK